MQIVDNIILKLNSIDGLNTVFYESGYGTNLRIDRKPTPAAVLYLIQGFEIGLKGGTRKDNVELEVFIFDRVDLAAKGEKVQEKLDSLMPLVNEFITLLASDKNLVMDGDKVEVQMAYGQFGTNVAGWSLQLKLYERQGRCIDSDTSGVKTIFISKNGEYNVVNYGNAVVDVVGGDIRLQEKTTTENGYITYDEGYNGLQGVTVQVPTPSGTLQQTITENGTQNFDVSSYQGIQITTNVPTGSECDLYEGLQVTQNGTYNPNTYQKDGFGAFSVQVPTPSGTLQQTITENGTQNFDVYNYQSIEITTEVQPAQTCSGTLQHTVTQNGSQTINVCGYENVELNVNVSNFPSWKGTYAQYIALASKDENTLYLITN